MEKNMLIIQASTRGILTAAIAIVKEDIPVLDFDDIQVVDLNRSANTINSEDYANIYVVDPNGNFSDRDLDRFLVRNHNKIKFFFTNLKLEASNKRILKRIIGANLKTCCINSYVCGIDLEKSDKCFIFERAMVSLRTKGIKCPLSLRIDSALKMAKRKEINKEIVLKLLFIEMISGQTNLQIEGLLEEAATLNRRAQDYQAYLIEHPEIGTIKVIVPMNGVPIQSLYKEKNGHDGLAIALKNGEFQLILSKKKKLEMTETLRKWKNRSHFIVNEKFLFREKASRNIK